MNARCMVAGLTVFLVIGSGVNAQTPEVIEKVERQLTLKRLHGVWVPDLLVTKQGAEPYPLSGRAMIFLDGDRFIRMEGKRNVESGTFKVEEGFLRLAVENRDPWDLEASGARPKAQYAFRVEGDVLTLCYSVGDSGKADDLSAGEGRQVVVYKRQRDGVREKAEQSPGSDRPAKK